MSKFKTGDRVFFTDVGVLAKLATVRGVLPKKRFRKQKYIIRIISWSIDRIEPEDKLVLYENRAS